MTVDRDRSLAGVPWLDRWEHFWFSPVPPHSFALLRILFGLLGLLGLLGVTPVSMYWPLDGITALPGHGPALRAQLFGLGLGTIAGWVFFVTLLLAFIAMTVGFASGLAVPICFVGSVLQTFWNHLPLSSAHQVLITVLFCLVWADTSSVLSFDAWRERNRTRESTFAAPEHPVWPLRLIEFQVAIIYLSSGLWKLFGPSWRDGSAVHDSLSLNIFHRFPNSASPDIDWLLTLGTYATLFWELTFPLMLLHWWTRRAVLIFGCVMHVGLWLTLELGPFSWVMIASYVAFLNPHAVSSVVQQSLRNSKSHRVVTAAS
jgi:hypothetical protein